MTKTDLCDECLHDKVCVLSRQLKAIGLKLTEEKENDVTYIPVIFGVIDCPEFKEAPDAD